MAGDSLAPGAAGRSHLGPGSRVAGELHFPGAVELPGYVSGHVEAEAILIEDSGEVEGELHAFSVEIRGSFKGRISGGTVRLHSTAKVAADIEYERLIMESGSELEGHCMVRRYQKPAKSP